MLGSPRRPRLLSAAKYRYETHRSQECLVCVKLESGLVVSVNHSEIEHLNDHSTKFFTLESKNKAGTETKIILPALLEIRRNIVKLTKPPRDFALDVKINATSDLSC